MSFPPPSPVVIVGVINYINEHFQIHRRTLSDDSIGIQERLDDSAIPVRGKHIVQFNKLSSAKESHRFTVEQEVFSPVVTFSKTPLASHNEWLAKVEKKVDLSFENELRSGSYLHLRFVSDFVGADRNAIECSHSHARKMER